MTGDGFGREPTACLTTTRERDVVEDFGDGLRALTTEIRAVSRYINEAPPLRTSHNRAERRARGIR